MNDSRFTPSASRGRSLPLGIAAVAALAFALGACGTGTGATIPPVPTGLPTIPADGLGSGSSACLDAATMAIVDQLKATGADVPSLLAANKQQLISGLESMEATDAAVQEWRDALVAAIDSDDAVAAAAEVARLSSGEVTIAAC